MGLDWWIGAVATQTSCLSLKCPLEIKKISIRIVDSVTDFGVTGPGFEVNHSWVFVNERSCPGEWVLRLLCLSDTEVTLTLSVIILRFMIDDFALGAFLEAIEPAIPSDLVRLIAFSDKFFLDLERRIWRVVSELITRFRSIGCSLGLRYYVMMGKVQSCQMSHKVMSMNFFEGSVFVAEMTSLAIWAEFFTIELSTILGLVLLI